MSDKKPNVSKILELAKLAATPEEEARLSTDFNNILKYIEQLDSVSVEGVEPLAHVHEVTNIFREDVAFNGLTPDEALLNAPDASGNFIRVPLVIEDSN